MNIRRSAVLLLLCFAFIPQLASAASPNVVISQIYGGGGNAGSTFKNDFIELFNRGPATVSLAGWSVQYTSSAGTTWTPTALTGSIAPGQYYLVQEAPGAGGTVSLPAPDASGTIAMSATSAKVALVSSTTALTGACPGGIVDLFGYGAANCAEGTAAPALTNATAAFRNLGGCTDSDSNVGDFAAAAPNPRNTASPIHTCTAGSNAPPAINAPLNPIATVSTGAAPFAVNLSGSDDGSIYSWSATAGAGIQSVSATSGQNSANVTYTVALTTGFSGTASFIAILSDTVNAPVSQLVNISVNGVVVNNPPTIAPPANPIRTVTENRPAFTFSLTGFDDGGIYAWSATTGPGIATASVSSGQSTSTATFTLTLQTDFTGTATFTALLSDTVNPAVSQLVNVNVTPPPPPPNHVVISQVYGGGGNTGATYHNDYVELYNPTSTTFDLRGWSVQYGSATGSIFTGVTSLAGFINPGEYYLIALASGGSPGATLPPANATNDLVNMSATSGKVALWNTGATISVGCPIGDPHLVDLVGYGTANCSEGNANAPAATNTTALFRINGGSTDTDINADDFVAGVPTPRRTATFAEVGPTVASTDPAAGDSGAHGAPRDGSITVTFSEPVTVDPSWFNISCASSGAHNDVTVAGGGTSWVITPNVNFSNAEQCTVTLTGNAIHDVDLDDSEPGTDTLPGDFTWSFFVAPSVTYPDDGDRSVHLTMGNPTNATADLNTPNNYLMMKPEYALSYNRDLGRPNWVSWHLTTEWFGSLARIDTFRPDPAVPADWYRVSATDFFTTGFDRGHMCPNADRDGQTTIVQETFVMSNMVAQAPDNNQGPWAQLEGYLRTLASAGEELFIVSGPSGVGGTGSNGGVTMTLANGHVTVPAFTWKAVIVLPKQDGNDVARVTASTPTVAVIMPNVNGIRNDDWHKYLTSVDAIEQLTGYDLFSNVPAAIQNAIEAGVNGDNPPGVGDESVSTPEDTAKTITLDVAAPNSNPLTYTIVTQPLHGTLAGSDVTQTYTPAPDFNGTDSFTYRVSDGTHTSNTARVTITILESNDPPAANDDAKSTNEDTPLSFAASDLTANDTAGPANESAQTLTVTTVSPAADTHGTATLNGTQIVYVPEANYNGPASFSYTVCDNGVTAGMTDSRCATATVHLTIVAVNDAPTAADDSKTTDEDTPFTFAASDLLANDSAGPADENGQTLAVTSVTATADTHGTVVLSAGQVSYAPEANYNGLASFSYRVCDNGSSRGVLDAQCATATVHLTIVAVNDAPTAADDSKTTDEDTSFTFAASDLIANDSAGPANENDQTLAVTSVAATADTHGTVTLNAGQVSYAPEANYNGPASFGYRVCDNGSSHGVADFQCATATVHLTIAAVNDAPTAADDSKTTDEDTPFTFAASDLMANDSAGPADENDQTLAVTSVTATADTHGTVTLNAGQVSYAPEANYNGPASFSYRVCDNGSSHGVLDAQCATATVHLTINPVNDPPSASITVAPTSAEGTAVTASVNVTDPDAGDAFTYAWSVTKNGAPYASSTSTSFTFTPNDNGSYVVSVTVTDRAGATGSDSKMVAVTNVAPGAVINGAPGSVAEGTPIALSAGVSDPGSADTFTYSWIVTRNGSPFATGNTPLLSFTPPDNGNYVVALTVTDDDGGSGSASASIAVNNVAPVITSLSLSSAAIDENGTVTLTGAFTDPGDDTHTVSINWGDGSAVTPVTLTHGSRTFSASHQYLDDAPSGTPSDVLSISVSVADNDGGSANSTTPITVNNVAPVITSVSGPTAPLTIGGTAAINVHYTDVGSRDTHTALLTWDDGSTSIGACAAGLCTASRTFPATGVFSVTITLTDDDGGVAAAQFAYVIVTNPNGPFVTGGGWFTSTIGKVSFSFNSKYQKNKTGPQGELELEREDIKFKGTSMDWLVVAGSKAQFAGTGSVNGFGTFRYLVTVNDGPVDKFRIRIWDKTSGTTVFDNVPGASDDIDDANPQPIGGGSIVIH